jgi:hypothetical protein
VLHGVISSCSKILVPAYPTKTLKEQIIWDYNIASICYCLVIVSFYTMALLESGETVQARWEHTCLASTHGLALHTASSLYECTCYLLSGKNPLFYLHHAVTMVCVGCFLATGRGHFYCCALGLVEASNVPLALLFVVPKSSLLYTMSGVLLWLSYTFIRFPVPLIMWSMWTDMLTHGPDFSNTTNTSGSGGERVAFLFPDPSQERLWTGFVFASGAFLWLLSLFWYWKITHGMIKVRSREQHKKSSNNPPIVFNFGSCALLLSHQASTFSFMRSQALGSNTKTTEKKAT